MEFRRLVSAVSNKSISMMDADAQEQSNWVDLITLTVLHPIALGAFLWKV